MGATLGVAGASGQNNLRKKKPRQASTSSSTANKARARRVLANSSGELAPSTDQPTGPKPVAASNENSIKPTDAADQGSEERAEPTGSKATEKPGDKSSEKPGDAKLLPSSAVDTKGTNASLDSLISLREQSDAAPSGPERVRLQLKLADQLVAADKKAEATTELHAITNADVFDPQGFYNVGNALARLGDFDEAVNAYRKAIDQRKGNYSRALNNLGVVLLRQGRWDGAYDAFMAALKLENFHYAEASYNLGRLYSARGESDLAIREWRRALAVDPEHIAAAQALSRGGSGSAIVRREAASTVVVKPESSDKGVSPTRTVHRVAERPVTNPVVSQAAPKSSKSREPVTKTLALDAVSYDFLQRARSLKESGKPLEAAENYRRVLSRSRGYFPPANLELSYILITLKRDDEALTNLLQVANRESAQYPLSYYYLGRLYERKGNLPLAEESFVNAINFYKGKNTAFLLDLSRVRERQGNFKGALAAMEQYVTAMEQQGLKPSWADESLSILRRKAAAEPK